MSGNLHRDSIRMRGFDYSKPAHYFITVCTHNRECIFGSIKNGKMTLSELGAAANECWLEITKHFPRTELHEYVIMPNHVHGIIQIIDNPDQTIEKPNIVGAKNFSPLHFGEINNNTNEISPQRDGKINHDTNEISPRHNVPQKI